MKTRKITLFALISTIAILMLFAFQSCKKYPENPVISLRTRTERVSNRWQVENYKVNGSDYTSLLSNYTETFSNNSNYSYNWGNVTGSGTWAFQNTDKEIKLSGNDARSSRTLIIVKLEEKAFWYYYMDGNDKYELHLVPN